MWSKIMAGYLGTAWLSREREKGWDLHCCKQWCQGNLGTFAQDFHPWSSSREVAVLQHSKWRQSDETAFYVWSWEEQSKEVHPLCLRTSAYQKKLPHSFPFLIVSIRKIGCFIKEKGNTRCKNQPEVRAGQKLLQRHRRQAPTLPS